ncbi:UNVERIFIED_CONTAM: hypothetical protein HHA_235500 [Hammondia hammondi]|eukprot:XP_008885548.1 hypothetical protein HHA_235500 [Hammondia hammondi]
MTGSVYLQEFLLMLRKGQNARLAPAGSEPEPAAPPEETEGPANSRSPGTPGTEAKDKCAEEKRQTPIPLRSLLCDAFKGASLAVTPVEVLYFLFHFLPEFHDQENALAIFQELREEKRKRRLERAAKSRGATNTPSNEMLSPSHSVPPPPPGGSSSSKGSPGFEECRAPSRAEAPPAPGALEPNANPVASDAKRNGKNTKLRSPIHSCPAGGRRGPGPDTSSPSSPSQNSKRGEKGGAKPRSENSRRRSGPRVTITNVPQVIVEESAPNLSTGTPRVDLKDRLDGSAKEYATTGVTHDDTNGDSEEHGNKHIGSQPTLRDGDDTRVRGKEENNHGMSDCRGKETTLKHHGVGVTQCWPRPFATRAIEKSYRKLLRKILGKRSTSWTELVYREVTVIEVMIVLLKIVEFKTPPCLAAQLSLPFRLSVLVDAIAQHELTQETCVSTSSTQAQRCWPRLSLRDHPRAALLTLVSSQDASELPAHLPPVIAAPPEHVSRTTVEKDSEKAPLSPSSHVFLSPALVAPAARGAQQSNHTGGPAPPEALLFSAPAQSPTSPDKRGVSASGAADGKKDFSNAFFWEGFDSVASLPRICEGKECGSFTVLDAPLLWAASEDDAEEENTSDRENEPSDTE